MSDTLNKLASLKPKKVAAAPTETTVANDAPQAIIREAKIDGQGRAYGTGRRKESTARVWVKRGSGKIIVNDKTLDVYFGRATQRMVIMQPFTKTSREGEFDVICTVIGGGLSGQAGAIRHGISRALCNFEPALRPALKKEGFLTRDSRMVERKKYGLRKARRRKQWKKR